MSKSRTQPTQGADHELFVDKPAVPVQRTRSENFASVYSNNVQVAVSYYDLRIHFNDVIASTKESIVVEELATVMMAPEQARDLLLALQRSVSQYEERFGALRPSPGGPTKQVTAG